MTATRERRKWHVAVDLNGNIRCRDIPANTPREGVSIAETFPGDVILSAEEIQPLKTLIAMIQTNDPQSSEQYYNLMNELAGKTIELLTKRMETKL